MTLPLTCMSRSRGHLLAVIDSLDVENSPKYAARDVTGDGKIETFCNYYVHDACALLEAEMPQMLARDQIAWLDSSPANVAGWYECSVGKAASRANDGFPTIAGWVNLAGGHSHIAMCVPAISDGTGIHVAQAGRTNFSNRPIASGFGVGKQIRFWSHP